MMIARVRKETAGYQPGPRENTIIGTAIPVNAMRDKAEQGVSKGPSGRAASRDPGSGQGVVDLHHVAGAKR